MQSVDVRTVPESRFSESEVAGFQRDGYVIVRGLADAQQREQMLAATLHGVAQEDGPIEYESDVHYPGSPTSRDSEGGRTVRRLLQAHSRGAVFTQWCSQPALVGRLTQLLGPQVVMPLAHHNCIMTKQPRFSSDTGWHQDIRYWSFTRPELVSVWLALRSETRENGCLRLVPGSHRMDIERSRFDEESFFRDDLPENQVLLNTQILAELDPGDALFFHCRTLHSASRNHTQAPKFSVVFTFRPADNPPLPGTRSSSLPELLLPELPPEERVSAPAERVG